MLKSKLKTILIIALLIIFVIAPFVRADEEDIMPISEEEETVVDENPTEEIDENMKNSDVYISGDNVTIDYTVVGNAFIVANNVTISAPIGGDAFIVAKNINIDANGYVYSNLFACSDTLIINGIVYDVYAACNNITIAENGYVYRDLHSVSSNIDIFGTVGRNAFIGCDKISLSAGNATSGYNTENLGDLNGVVYGNLEYSSSDEITVPEGSVNGEVKFNKMTIDNKSNITDIILSIIASIVFTVVIWLILNWLTPNYIEKAKELLTTKIGFVILFGLLGLILLPIISLILLFTPVTSGLSFLLLGIYMILIALSSSIFVITLSEFVADKLNLSNKWLKLAIVAAGALVVYLLKLIPYVSIVVSLVCIVLGLGVLVKGFLPNKKQEA